MGLRKIFIEHPATVGETYGEHFGQASSFAWKLMVASFACAIHGLIPALFDGTGSRTVKDLHHRMVTHRTSLPPKSDECAQLDVAKQV